MTEWLRCRDCKRPLRSAEARRTGYGSKCGRKHQPPRVRSAAKSLGRRARAAKVPPAPDALPGQTELDLFHHQATLWSI